MAYRGAGAPPPKTGGGGSFKNTKPVYHLAEKVTGKNGTELKLVRGLKIQVDERDRPVVTLDNLKNLDDCYTCNLHVFNLRGTKDNMVVCPKTETDARPCPICTVFNKAPTWFACLTGIDRSKWSPPEGKNQHVVYTDNRRLVLISNTRKSTMQLYIDKAEGVRGSKWTISRSKPSEEIGKDGQKYTSFKNSPRIGDLWFPSGKMTEEEMKKDFEKAASTYGLPVEKFVQPFDYEFMLKPKDHKQLLAIANDIKEDPTALKDQGFNGSDGDEDAGNTAPAATPTDAKAEIKY